MEWMTGRKPAGPLKPTGRETEKAALASSTRAPGDSIPGANLGEIPTSVLPTYVPYRCRYVGRDRACGRWVKTVHGSWLDNYSDKLLNSGEGRLN